MPSSIELNMADKTNERWITILEGAMACVRELKASRAYRTATILWFADLCHAIELRAGNLAKAIRYDTASLSSEPNPVPKVAGKYSRIRQSTRSITDSLSAILDCDVCSTLTWLDAARKCADEIRQHELAGEKCVELEPRARWYEWETTLLSIYTYNLAYCIRQAETIAVPQTEEELE